MEKTLDAAGVTIPRLGIGTFQMAGDVCVGAVTGGIAAGFRHIDTAEMYGNEVEVGEGIRASGVPREDLFVTTKVWHENLAEGRLQQAAEGSLKRLGLNQVDLFLIHWPSASVPLDESVKALASVKSSGLARAVGVSNFPVRLLNEAVARSPEPLAVNQVEYHPFLRQDAVLDAVRANAMALTAYCPLARATVVDNPVVRDIAGRHGVDPAVVALSWLLSQDRVMAIPKSRSPERLAAALTAHDLVLTAAERDTLSALAHPNGRMVKPAFAPQWDAA
ncbi:MAG: aldo/keto reductase [Pseudomonadota bacterium]